MNIAFPCDDNSIYIASEELKMSSEGMNNSIGCTQCEWQAVCVTRAPLFVAKTSNTVEGKKFRYIKTPDN
jgi:hypothetical protein